MTGSRKRASPDSLTGKRVRQDSASPKGSNPSSSNGGQQPAAKRTKIPKGGRRGAALLQAAGVAAGGRKVADRAVTAAAPAARASGAPGSGAKPRNDAPRPPIAYTATRRAQLKVAQASAPPDCPLLRQRLPVKLLALKEIFGAIQTVYEMLRRRGRRTTFINLKSAVEEAGGRRFEESHLRQLQALLPEILSLHNVTLPLSPRSTRTARQLLLTMAPDPEGRPASALRALLHRRLAQHLLDAHAAHLRAAARERHALGDPVGAAELERAAQRPPPLTDFFPPFPEGVPDVGGPSNSPLASDDTPGVSSSPQPVSSCARVTFSQSPPVGETAAAPEAPPAAQPRDDRRRRSLCFTTCTAESEAVLAAAQKDAAALLFEAPEELRRRSIQGVISLDSLRALEGNEAAHRRLSSATAHAAREASAALGALPKTFTRLQRIFGQKGPTAMKMGEVVERVRRGGDELASEVEIIARVMCLAEHAPEFVQLKPWGRCGTPAVWIDRACDANAVAAKLKAVAGRRSSMGVK